MNYELAEHIMSVRVSVDKSSLILKTDLILMESYLLI